MLALQDQRQPLYGRFDLSLLVHPFGPHESALMLEQLDPADRALVYGVVGGMPLYLSWWDQSASVGENLMRLICQPGGRLLVEGDLVMRSDLDAGDHAPQVLYAVANGRTKHGEIKDQVGIEPARILDRLIELRLIERVQPVGESPATRRRRYRVADPFLRFMLGTVARYRTEIERGLGGTINKVVLSSLDDHMGAVFGEAFRHHLRVLAVRGTLPIDGPAVAVGPWWDTADHNEIDALVLAGRLETAVLAGEAKWTREVDGERLVRGLRRKVADGPGLDPDALSYVVCARSVIRNLPTGSLGLTADDLFSPFDSEPPG